MSDNFNFEISLSVLNHLGRNLYRNFITVLGEAISNAWDADAENVWISIDKEKGTFSIKDDGVGMDAIDFQEKFLKIGYSKRASGAVKTTSERPFIGAKGIGKLALLSCAKRISIYSKRIDTSYVGGVIDNSGLDSAIKRNLTPDKYALESVDESLIDHLKKGHKKGTIIYFENAKDQIKNSIAHIKKLIALNFHFSLIDENFSIYVNGEKVSFDDLKDLMDSTEFVWVINNLNDEFVQRFQALNCHKTQLTTPLDIKGFIASTVKPRSLKITGTEERATVDLFVNGRLREKNILRHIPTQRIIESYIYGQLHFDSMDSEVRDPFTSSREGIVEDDKNFQSLLDYLKRTALPAIFDSWDKLRLDRGDEGDSENLRKTPKQRKARGLFSITKSEYAPEKGSPNKDQVEEWLESLREDAEFNLSSYADCFLSENLVRKFIEEKKLELKDGVKKEADQWRERESGKKGKANLSFDIRKDDADTSYLGMDALALTAEGKKGNNGKQSLCDDAVAYAPVRNVIGHTGLLTATGKSHLNLKYENIKARLKMLIVES
jgi:hypothetical protein